MSKRKSGPLPALVVGTLVVATVCTLTVQGGWLVWVPTLPALLVVAGLGQRTSDR